MKNSRGSMLSCGVQVLAVGKDDVGAFATALQINAFQIRLTRVLHELLAHLSGAGKGEAVDLHRQGQRFTHGMAIAGEYLKHPGGQARLLA